MNDRIDQYVEERADAEALARAVSDTRAFIEARPAPDLTAAVMQRVSRISDAEPARRPGVFAAVRRFLWLPRQISIRPAYAVAAAGAVLALFVALESQTTTVRTT